MFDTVLGLPVHVLVVHGVVVLLPLAAVLTLAVAYRPGWRSRLSGVVVGANAVVYAITLVAKESGEALQNRLGTVAGQPVAETHGDYGGVLPWFALALLIASALVWFASPRGGLLIPSALLAVTVAAIGALGWTVVVGDSGARAVWEDVVRSTDAD